MSCAEKPRDGVPPSQSGPPGCFCWTAAVDYTRQKSERKLRKFTYFFHQITN